MRKIIALCAAVLIFAGIAAAQDNTTATVATDSAPAPAAASHKLSTENSYPWQVGANFTYQRFDIGGGNSNLYGIQSSVNRWLGDSMFGIEGAVSATFGRLNAHDREQVVFYGGGLHVGKHEGKFQPWAHILAGGTHDRFNQTVGPASFNSFGIMGGGGLDIQWRSHVAFRVQADFLGSRFGSVWQKTISTGGGVVFDF
jgi:hypothetical protein